MFETDLDTQLHHYNWRDAPLPCTPSPRVESFPSGYKDMSFRLPETRKEEKMRVYSIDRIASEYHPTPALSCHVIEPFPRAGICTSVKSRGHGQNGCVL